MIEVSLFVVALLVIAVRAWVYWVSSSEMFTGPGARNGKRMAPMRER